MKYFISLLLLYSSVVSAQNIPGVSMGGTRYMGTGTTEEKACDLAKSKASMGGLEAGKCTCEKPAQMYICRSESGKPRAKVAQDFVNEKKPRPTQCAALIKYRDTKLVADIDSAINFATRKGEVASHF